VEFTEVVRRRHMVRRFTDEPVSAESLDRILHNAVRGPSAGFSQGQAFLVLTGEDLKRFWPVAGEAADDPVAEAPLVIVPMSAKRVYLDRYALPDKGWTDRDEKRWPVPFWHIDTGMAALLILLTVVDEGLGALYFGIVPEAVGPFREAFGVPDDHEPIGAIAIGHNAEPAPRDLRARRRRAADVIHYGRWQGQALADDDVADGQGRVGGQVERRWRDALGHQFRAQRRDHGAVVGAQAGPGYPQPDAGRRAPFGGE
jgi:nitroreductase